MVLYDIYVMMVIFYNKEDVYCTSPPSDGGLKNEAYIAVIKRFCHILNGDRRTLLPYSVGSISWRLEFGLLVKYHMTFFT